MTLLASTPWRRNPAESGTERFVVGEQAELPALQGEPEMADGQVGAQELTVECGVAGLRVRKLL